METDYAVKLRQEMAAFENLVDIDALPASHNYIAAKYWQPRLTAMGFSSLDDFYIAHILKAAGDGARPVKLLSVGAGNCETEVRLGAWLQARGLTDWVFECLDLNPPMLERGRARAEAAGVGGHFCFTAADIRAWDAAPESYDVILASHSLHHFVELELLFEKIKNALRPNGYFLANDMIGRNGHRRWVEVMQILKPLWSVLDEAHRFNRNTKMVEREFINWDYSTHGFEGIRAQDILPLLIKAFSFEVFFGFANLIDPFVDRAFGHNFDPQNEADRVFLDLVAALDDHFLETGVFKPTHMIAAMTVTPRSAEPRCYKHLTPGFCVHAT